MLKNLNENIIQDCLKNNPQAQRQLYNELLPYLRAVVNRYLKDSSYSMDVLQESFVKIFKNLSRFDKNKSPFKNWCAKIVINCCINYNKRVIGNNLEEFNHTTHNILVNTEDLSSFTDEHLLLILKQMPQNLYNVFNMHVIDEYAHKEIAEILNISEANSRKLLSRAKQWLRDTFKEDVKIRSYLRIV